MDLDEGEVNKDIEFIKELIEQNKIDIKGVSYGKQYSILRTIKIILAEREADKKRIKELEEALLKVKDKNIKLFINSKNSIPKQKVKDKIKELKKEYEIALEENSTKAFILKCKISALEELEEK